MRCGAWILVLSGTLPVVGGCVESDGGRKPGRGAGNRVEPRAWGAPTCTRMPPLRARFIEELDDDPAHLVEDRAVPLGLELAGSPGGLVSVRLLATEGVDVLGYSGPFDVALDAEGEAMLDLELKVSGVPGCAVVAQATLANGGTCETRCVLGGRHESAGPRANVRRTAGGSEVRLSPSR